MPASFHITKVTPSLCPCQESRPMTHGITDRFWQAEARTQETKWLIRDIKRITRITRITRCKFIAKITWESQQFRCFWNIVAQHCIISVRAGNATPTTTSSPFWLLRATFRKGYPYNSSLIHLRVLCEWTICYLVYQPEWTYVFMIFLAGHFIRSQKEAPLVYPNKQICHRG